MPLGLRERDLAPRPAGNAPTFPPASHNHEHPGSPEQGGYLPVSPEAGKIRVTAGVCP